MDRPPHSTANNQGVIRGDGVLITVDGAGALTVLSASPAHCSSTRRSSSRKGSTHNSLAATLLMLKVSFRTPENLVAVLRLCRPFSIDKQDWCRQRPWRQIAPFCRIIGGRLRLARMRRGRQHCRDQRHHKTGRPRDWSLVVSPTPLNKPLNRHCPRCKDRGACLRRHRPGVECSAIRLPIMADTSPPMSKP